MLDIRLIRDNPQDIIEALAKKGADAGAVIEAILDLDTQRRELIHETEQKKAEQNKVSKQIPAMKKAGEDTAAVMAEMKALSEAIKEADVRLRAIETEIEGHMLALPNRPDDDLPGGDKENNETIRVYGEPRVVDFEPK
ncbi:MAG: serine--tRNA ligase, partial [Oscillospiraceae bacterium]|nr:serine--tRNA ligase [Oscillospiraceae bacterium]